MTMSVKILNISLTAIGKGHEVVDHEVSDAPNVESTINTAVKSLKNGNVIAIPTDTIYGVAALAQSTEAVSKLYEIKRRHEEKPVAICVGNLEDVYK